MDYLRMLGDEAKHLCGACRLAVVESYMDVEDALAFSNIMFANSFLSASFTCLLLSEVRWLGDFDVHVLQRKVLA